MAELHPTLPPPPLPHPPLPPHPLHHGDLFSSPGCHFSYRVIGPCCRLFDREQLPWPCCRLQWRGKEPSWRRIGRRFVPDLGTKRHPSYSVEIVGQGLGPSPNLSQGDGQNLLEPMIITLYPVQLPPAVRDWWHADKPLSQSLAGQTKEA
jgi:hypothetical protein